MGLLPSYAPQRIDLPSLYFNNAPIGNGYARPKAPNIGERLTDGLHRLGVSQRTANRLGDKVMGALNGLTPLGAVEPAQAAGRDARQGNYAGAALNGLGAMLSAMPDGGGMFAHGVGSVAHSIIAPLWHGSAAKFDRFANEFISSGEGAQAYGYGHYLSESRRLANSYRNPKLAPNMPPDSGHLYEVSVDANPADFVDLDAALHTQPAAVQSLARSTDLSRYKPGRRERVMLERFSSGMEQPEFPATGQTLHNMFTDYGLDAAANQRMSELLRGQGFAGLRYGQPRNALGGGGRNYVVFDPNIIDILNRH